MNDKFDLENRTLEYAKRIRTFIKKLPRTISNVEDSRQLNNASGSVGANYIEANEGVSKNDFVYRIKISLKEVKESTYWLKLIDTESNDELEHERDLLITESIELTKIFSTIIRKSK